MAEAKLGALRLKRFYAIGFRFPFFSFGKPFFKKKKKSSREAVRQLRVSIRIQSIPR